MDARIVYRNANVITDGAVSGLRDVVCEDGRILELCPAGSGRGGRTQDFKGAYLAPGFIDLHCHGAGGYEFLDGTEEAVRGAAAVHAANGTRVLYPTLSASSFDTVWKALEVLEAARDGCALLIPGVHLEGPYLSPEMSGAQEPGCITAPVEADYTRLWDRFGSLIARWTYAPERDRDGRFLVFLREHGIIPSIGHSAAEYDCVLRAYEGGCRLVTHLYSCTSTVIRRGGFRKLGIIESAWLLDGLYVEAITDGCHLPPELLRMILKIKGSDHVALITDAIRYAGTESSGPVAGSATLSYLIEDGVAKLADRSAFAGSIATTGRILRVACGIGIPLGDTVKMLTRVPAEIMGLPSLGRIAPGYDAVFTAFDQDLNILPDVR